MGVIRGSSYYTIVDGPTWTQAEANAVALGGHLVSIESSEENATVQQVAKNYFAGLDSFYDGAQKYYLREGAEQSSDLWIGLKGTQSEGQWEWSSGDMVSYLVTEGLYDDNGLQDYGAIREIWNWAWDDQENNDSQNVKYGRADVRYSQKAGISEIPLSYFSISDLILKEGEKGKVAITRTGGTQSSQTLTLSTFDGTAVDGDDYVQVAQTLIFAAGEESKTVTISTIEDDLIEGEENFSLTLSASGADAVPVQISDSASIVKILDNDEALPHGNKVNANNVNPINGKSNIFISSVNHSIANVDHDRVESIDNSVTIINNSVSNEFADNLSTNNLVNSGNTMIDSSATNIYNSQIFTITELTSNTNQGMICLRDESGSRQDLLRPFDTKESGTSQDDYLDGSRKSSNKEFFEGGAGDDVLMGRQGGDVLSGGSGKDLIRAGHGRDVITGGTGGDMLYGGFGHNIFTGEKDGEADTLSFKSDQHLWNWLYDKAGNNADGSKLDVIHSLDAIDKIRVQGVETSQLGFESINNFSGPTGNYSGIGIYSDGFLEAIYTGGDLSASQLQSMTVGVDA